MREKFKYFPNDSNDEQKQISADYNEVVVVVVCGKKIVKTREICPQVTIRLKIH
jgi:hypothetical protein